MDYLPALIDSGFNIDAVLPPEACPNGHIFVMKSLGGELVIKDGHSIKSVKVRRARVENVGINKIFRTSEVGMTYNYVCIAPGQKFKSLVVDLDAKDMLEGLGYDLKVPYKLQLGRGATRGLGYIEIRIKELRLEDIVKELELRAKAYSPHVLLLAKSPIFSIGYDSDLMKVRLHHELSSLKYDGGWIPKLVYYSGFSLASRLPKARLKCASPGSLYHYTLSNGLDKGAIEELTKVTLVGLPPHNHLGLNILEVV
ncbi:MAG: hypothetical protein NZ931_06015 [Aigarchaeota archaeon]|nr:hypothetical protein [Aigarchaeota archaeon]